MFKYVTCDTDRILPLYREQSYVRVIGNLKSFGNNKFINAIRIRPIVDPHEPYYHALEACTVSLIMERGPVRSPAYTSFFMC